MYINTFDKQAGLKKSISCILIALIMTLGFPFSAFSTSNSESTPEKPGRVEKSPIQADKKEGAIGTVKHSSFDGSNEHFAIIEEFKIDKGFWFSLFAISELARKDERNDQSAFNFKPIGFSFTGSGFSPTYTQINNGANTSTIIRDNITGKLALPAGKSVLIEGLNQALGKTPGNNEIRQGEWEENIKISVEEYTGIRSFKVPVSFKTEPVNREKSLFRISFESEPSVYNLKSNSSIRQKFNGFIIVGAADNKVYFSVFRYEGDCFQYENGSQADHFVGQQIGYLANPDNGKATLNSSEIGGFDRLLVKYPTINTTSGSFSEKETTPPEWMGKVLGMSRLLQVNTAVTAEKHIDFAPIAIGLGGHIIDGLWSMAFNTASFLKDIASGGQTDAQIGEVKNRLFDSKVSFIRNLYDPDKETKDWTGIGPKVDIIEPSAIGIYSKIGGDRLGLPGDLLVVNKDTWEILRQTGQGKYPGIEESASAITANLEQVSQKYLWSKNPFARAPLFNNGYGRIAYGCQVYDEKRLISKDSTSYYFAFFQTLEYKGDHSQHRSSFLSTSVIKKNLNTKKNIAHYRVVSKGQILEPKLEKNELMVGPLDFFRNCKTDNIYFGSNSVKAPLLKNVLNQTINQLKKSEHIVEKRVESISLDLAGNYFPQKLSFNITTNEIKVGEKKGVYLMRYQSEPFSFNSLSGKHNSQVLIRGNYSGSVIFSPAEDQIYFYSSLYGIQLGEESLYIREFGYLSDANGKRVYPNMDFTSSVVSETSPIEAKQLSENLPLWVYQGIKVHQVVSLSALTVGENGTNPFPLIFIGGGIMFADTVSEIFFGYSFIDDLAGRAADWIGGENLKTKVLENMTIVKLGISYSIAMVAPPLGILVGITESFADVTSVLLTGFEHNVEQNIKQLETQAVIVEFNKNNMEKKFEKPPKKKSKIIKKLLIAAGVVVVGGTAILLGKSAGKNGEDITDGTWTLSTTCDDDFTDEYGNPITEDCLIKFKSDGTVDIPTYSQQYRLTRGNYSVQDDNIKIELLFHLYSSEYLSADYSYVLSGKIYDSNTMSGSLTLRVDWLFGPDNYSGTWSAKR